MIHGLATQLFSPLSSNLLLARSAAIGLGDVSTTLYVSDTQIEHLGPRPFTNNPLLKSLFPAADRNVIATQTAAVFIDELLRQAKQRHQGENLSIQIVGDIPNTPAVSEMATFEEILERQDIPITGYTRGNHSSANAFGVVNSRSRFYNFIRKVPFFRRFSLRREVWKACGEGENMLTAQGSFEGMHRMLNHHRQVKSTIDQINRPVLKADYKEYQISEETPAIRFDSAHLEQNFRYFWTASASNESEDSEEPRYWEAMVNYQVADTKVGERDTKVPPFYIQATEEARFDIGNGQELPVYSISLDSLDHNNFLAVSPELSELQIRLVETFMDTMIAEAKRQGNPPPRFKLSSHFSTEQLLKRPWVRFWKGRQARKALKRLLKREEVILFTSGHTHERAGVDLNSRLRLKRKTHLPEIIVPSLIDYHPFAESPSKTFQNARALMIEKMRVEEDLPGQLHLEIDLEYKGLDKKATRKGLTPEVRQELKDYQQEHAYMRTRETLRESRSKHFVGWIKSHLGRFGEFIAVGLFGFFHSPVKQWHYWRTFSFTQYVIDNFTVLSTVNMFNEAFHLIPLLDSLIKFIDQEVEDPGKNAVRDQIKGLRYLLGEEYRVRRHEFESALSRGMRAEKLREFNDLFVRAETDRLARILLDLKPESQARIFAVLAGLAASKEEFEYHRRKLIHRRKPTRIPNQIPTLSFPIHFPSQPERRQEPA